MIVGLCFLLLLLLWHVYCAAGCAVVVCDALPVLTTGIIVEPFLCNALLLFLGYALACFPFYNVVCLHEWTGPSAVDATLHLLPK